MLAQSPVPSTMTPTDRRQRRLRYCLNTSTINGGSLPVRQQVQIAARAGYDAVELWTRDIDKFVAEGGQLNDLRAEMHDLGLRLDSAIAFGKWIVDDEDERRAGLEQCRRDMELVRELGGTHSAAPPGGVTNPPRINLAEAAGRYRRLLELGRQQAVIPQLELWGFSRNLATLADVLYVAAAAQDADACLLLDVYHLYKGGFDFANTGLIPASRMPCLHMNDYPAEPDRARLPTRIVYSPETESPRWLKFCGLCSGQACRNPQLELFNRSYWELPAEEVASTGLRKMKQAVAAAVELS